MILYEDEVLQLNGLNKVDKLIEKLQNSTLNSDREIIKKQLEEQLQNVFNTKFEIDIHYLGVYSYNFGVIVEYGKPNIDKKITDAELKELSKIKKIKMIMGFKLLTQLKPRQTTAIILHEMGHVVNHLAKSIIDLRKLLIPINTVLYTLSVIPGLHILSFPLFLIVSRSLLFTEHMQEYNADKFAVQCGYGTEMMQVLRMFDKHEKKPALSFSDILQKIQDFFLGTTHPSSEDRIKKMIHLIKEGYEDKYKGLDLKKILAEYS